MNTSVKSQKDTEARPESPCQPSKPTEEQLDDALDDSFPASDPPAAVTPDSGEEKREDDALDDALDDSFPASDPPSVTQPG